MTEADYDSKIAENRQAVTGYQQEIGKLEEEIQELKTFRTELGNFQGVLHDTASRAESQINGITGLTGMVMAAVSQNFFAKVLAAVRGEEYASADSGLTASQDRIDEKITELQNMIGQKQSAISACNAGITSLESGKAQYLAEKAAEEAAKAAAAGEGA